MSTGLVAQIDRVPGEPVIGRWTRLGLDRPPPPVRRQHPPWKARARGDDTAEREAPTEERLARLAAALGPLRRVLAAIAERLIATRAYERLCYARIGDYARERPGISARQLQELARVHRGLTGLPALEQALVANELPWSKVRLVARVASAADEGAWIARARSVSTRRLEQEVRDARRNGERERPEEADDALPDTRLTLRCTPAVGEKWVCAREVAERMAGERLPAGEALEWVVAEAFSSIAVDPAFIEALEPPSPPRGKARSSPEGRPLARKPARILPREIELLAEKLDAADPHELDRRLQLALRLEQSLDAAIAPLLRVVTSPEHEWSGDYETLGRYAREQLGMSASKARALLRLERAGDVCPALREAYRRGRLSWVKSQCLLPLLLLDIDGEYRPLWVAWAERVTLRRLEADVERALLLRAGHERAWQRCKFHPERAQEPIPLGERQMCAPDIDPEATQQLAWRVPREVAALFRGVRETLRSRLWSERGRWLLDGEVFDALLDCALVSWTLRDPDARRSDPVIERDGYACAVPGCTLRRSLHDHHVRFRSAGGSHATENRITLCAFHHLRCLHAGLLGIRGRAPDGLVFELGLRPGAAPLARYRSGDVSFNPASEPRACRGTGCAGRWSRGG